MTPWTCGRRVSTTLNWENRESHRNRPLQLLHPLPKIPHKTLHNETVRYCTFCQIDGHFADWCFKNPNGNRYNENYGKFNKPQNRDKNCGLCISKMHLAPACDIYPKAIIVAEPCQHCLKEYRQKFFHIESICMLVQRRKDQAEPGR